MRAVITTVRTSRPSRRRTHGKAGLRRAGRQRRPFKRQSARAARRDAAGIGMPDARTGFAGLHNVEYERGYRSGIADGAENLLERHVPAGRIIPDVTADEAMEAGVQALLPRSLPLLGVEQVFGELDGAVREGRSYAFIRLGDGELATLAQEVVLPAADVRITSPFLPYAGVVVPDLYARDRLAEAIRDASLVGVPISRQPNYQPLLFRVLRAHNIPCDGLRLTTSTMNYALYEHDYLPRLLAGRKVLLVGNVAGELARVFHGQGYSIVGVVSPVRGFGDVDRVVAEGVKYDFDIALVSAGIPAIPIVVRLAALTGKVALDFGHLADRIAGVKTRILSQTSE